MLLHYLGKFKIQVLCKKTQTNGILIASNIVIHPQILIFSVQCVNNQHGIQRRGQDVDKKKFVFEEVHSKLYLKGYIANCI